MDSSFEFSLRILTWAYGPGSWTQRWRLAPGPGPGPQAPGPWARDTQAARPKSQGPAAIFGPMGLAH